MTVILKSHILFVVVVIVVVVIFVVVIVVVTVKLLLFISTVPFFSFCLVTPKPSSMLYHYLKIDSRESY